jgi:small subunit ribosomal protein S25e
VGRKSSGRIFGGGQVLANQSLEEIRYVPRETNFLGLNCPGRNFGCGGRGGPTQRTAIPGNFLNQASILSITKHSEQDGTLLDDKRILVALLTNLAGACIRSKEAEEEGKSQLFRLHCETRTMMLTTSAVVCIGKPHDLHLDCIADAWFRSKGKVKDKAQHAVILDKATSDKLNKDVQSYRLVTVATLVDRMKVNGSLARKCLKDLEEKGLIKPVVTHNKMKIYSMFCHRGIGDVAIFMFRYGC